MRSLALFVGVLTHSSPLQTQSTSLGATGHVSAAVQVQQTDNELVDNSEETTSSPSTWSSWRDNVLEVDDALSDWCNEVRESVCWISACLLVSGHRRRRCLFIFRCGIAGLFGRW
jgi:hypothetical protein